MRHPHLRQVSEEDWERMKCDTRRHLHSSPQGDSAALLINREPGGHISKSANPWEDARFCAHYDWCRGMVDAPR